MSLLFLHLKFDTHISWHVYTHLCVLEERKPVAAAEHMSLSRHWKRSTAGRVVLNISSTFSKALQKRAKTEQIIVTVVKEA